MFAPLFVWLCFRPPPLPALPARPPSPPTPTFNPPIPSQPPTRLHGPLSPLSPLPPRSKLERKLPQETAHAIIREAVDLECLFVSEALAIDLIGMVRRRACWESRAVSVARRGAPPTTTPAPTLSHYDLEPT